MADREVDNQLQVVRNTIAVVFNAIWPHLPSGCPFTIGGGLIRDGVLGGPIGDIDVWLPSNCNVPANVLNGTLIFDFAGNFTNGQYTRDISNRWVTEVELSGIKVNLMKRLDPYVDNQQWFDSLNYGFDTELSMMFMGFVPEDGFETRECAWENLRGMNHISIPYSILEHLNFRPPIPQALSSLGVNEERMETTSATRMEARIQKLGRKYHLVTNFPFPLGREDLRAVIVPLRRMMELLDYMPTVRLE